MTTPQLFTERPSLGAVLQRSLTSLRPVLQRALTRSWPETPLSPSQARVLQVVRLHPGISPGYAASELREDPDLTAAIIEQLAALEILTAERSHDHANVELRLTRRGRLRSLAWQGKSGELLDHALEMLSAPERAAIALALPALERLADALGDL